MKAFCKCLPTTGEMKKRRRTPVVVVVEGGRPKTKKEGEKFLSLLSAHESTFSNGLFMGFMMFFWLSVCFARPALPPRPEEEIRRAV